MDSHVTPGLEISGTQPSAVPGDDYDGSGIGLAEVSTVQPSPAHNLSTPAMVRGYFSPTDSVTTTFKTVNSPVNMAIGGTIFPRRFLKNGVRHLFSLVFMNFLVPSY